MQVRDLIQATIDERELDVQRHQLERQAASRPASVGEVHFLTSAARVLATVAREPGATMREIAETVGQTERAVWDQLRQLERAGLLTRQRVGRRNTYRVDQNAVQRHLLAEGAALLGA